MATRFKRSVAPKFSVGPRIINDGNGWAVSDFKKEAPKLNNLIDTMKKQQPTLADPKTFNGKTKDPKKGALKDPNKLTLSPAKQTTFELPNHENTINFDPSAITLNDVNNLPKQTINDDGLYVPDDDSVYKKPLKITPGKVDVKKSGFAKSTSPSSYSPSEYVAYEELASPVFANQNQYLRLATNYMCMNDGGNDLNDRNTYTPKANNLEDFRKTNETVPSRKGTSFNDPGMLGNS